MDSAEKTATLRFAKPLPAGKAFLKITYSGILNDKMDGFYRSAYTNRQGEPAVMASTFFCATTASAVCTSTTATMRTLPSRPALSLITPGDGSSSR